MTDEILKAIDSASTMTELEDIYRPYRPKRKTRASVAKGKGLGALAEFIYAQEKSTAAPEILAKEFLSEEVETVEDALQGARDIIAEMISDDANGRKILRHSIKANGLITAKGAKEDLGVYEMYKEYSEPISKVARHRVLAMNRGEKEGYLKVAVDYDKITGLGILYDLHCKSNTAATDEVRAAAEDSYTRLIFPSLEREIRNELTENACDDSIKVFSENTRQLLCNRLLKTEQQSGSTPDTEQDAKLPLLTAPARCLTPALSTLLRRTKRLTRLKKSLRALLKNMM